MFLWNPFQGAAPETYRALSQELTNALIAKKVAEPEVRITVVSDPINTVYDGQRSAQFDALRAADIPVILTNHRALRDSNPTYSSFWRLFLQWPDLAHRVLVGSPYTFRLIPNIMDTGGEDITLRAYLALFNFKANHRKLIVADRMEEGVRTMTTLVTSANPHDGSSRHSNVALVVEDGIWQDAVKGEEAVAEFSGGTLFDVPLPETIRKATGAVSVQLLSERAILERTLRMLAGAGEGDSVSLVMFYLAHGDIIDALIGASDRGARVWVILDPNKDAFGLKKNGIPNRQAAAKLLRDTNGAIEVRWCATHGEQCHTKLLITESSGGHELLLGSANYTRRNLNNLNLETDVWVGSEAENSAYRDASRFFEELWGNGSNRLFTLPYEDYRNDSNTKRFIAWFMEHTGLSTF
jgi:phosphatidylserine/phosphatidylglycerophosphate/cardiolipin synthase-like enzyme